jgi:hypothetical protein
MWYGQGFYACESTAQGQSANDMRLLQFQVQCSKPRDVPTINAKRQIRNRQEHPTTNSTLRENPKGVGA